MTKVEVESFYDMANLFPKHTGLPFVVWISSRGGAKHDVRVKIAPGPKARLEEMVTVGLRPEVHVVEGTLSARDLALVGQWIEMNRETLLRYWEEEIDTVDALQQLKIVVSEKKKESLKEDVKANEPSAN